MVQAANADTIPTYSHRIVYPKIIWKYFTSLFAPSWKLRDLIRNTNIWEVFWEMHAVYREYHIKQIHSMVSECWDRCYVSMYQHKLLVFLPHTLIPIIIRLKIYVFPTSFPMPSSAIIFRKTLKLLFLENDHASENTKRTHFLGGKDLANFIGAGKT